MLKTKKTIWMIITALMLLLALSACTLLPGAPAEAPADTAPAASPQTADTAAPAPVDNTATAPDSPAATLDGNWANEDPAAPGITRMSIRSEGSTVFVQMWTHCDADECAWEEQSIPLANPLELTWKTGVATNLQTITLLDDGRLQVDEQIQFTDGSGRGDVGLTSYLIKQ